MARVAAGLAAVVALCAIANAGACLRCSDDFISTQMRRGRGGGSSAVFSQPLSATITQGLDGAQYTDPSAGWRNDVDGVVQANNRLWITYQGPPNWWIDTVTNQLKIATVVGAPTGNPGYRDATDPAGPMFWRDGTAYTRGRLATMTNVLTGSMGGAYFIYETGGVVADFEEFSVDIAAYDVGVGGAVGVVLAYNAYNSGKTHYCVVMKNHTTETGIGLYKVNAGIRAAVPLATTTAASYRNNAGTATTMNANGPRLWTKLIVARTGGRIQVWVDSSIGTPLIDFTDPNPLPPGNVGLHVIGSPAVVFDNVVLAETPSCSDGLWNGAERGIDCGGACPTPCSFPIDFNHDFTAQGIVGWRHETYGNDPNGAFYGAAFVFSPSTDGVTQPTNVNGNLPGSTGTLSQGWTGSFWFTPASMPPAFDVDATFEVYPKDNDYIGVVWRFLDRDNFYAINMRAEGGAGTPKLVIQRRRAGQNTPLWGSSQTDLPVGFTTGNPNCPDSTGNFPRTPYHACTRQAWRIRMVGPRIEVYLPDWTTFASLQSTALNPVLVAVAIDPDPLMAPGQVGFIATSHDGLTMYNVKARALNDQPPALTPAAQDLPISAAARAALVLGADARPLDPTLPQALVPDYSPMGRGLYNSPFIVGTAFVPTVVPYRRCGNAIRLSAGTFLYSNQRQDSEPGVVGMTFVIAFMPTAVPASGTTYTIAAKGQRNPTSNGWKLTVADRGTGPRVFFTARSSVLAVPTDNLLEVSTPLPGANIPLVAVVTVQPDPTQTPVPSRLEARRFVAQAFLNNATFADTANNVLTGVVGTGESSLLYVGALEDGSQPAEALLFEVLAFSVPLSLSDSSALYGSLARKWAVGSSGGAVSPCENLTASVPDVTFLTPSACAGGANGDVCELACPSGFMSVGGVASLTCRAGVWDNPPLTCVRTCAVPSDTTARNMDQESCSFSFFSEAFTGALPGASAAPALPLEVGACSVVPPYQTWRAVPQGANAWQVRTPGVLTRIPVGGISRSLVFFDAGYYSYEPSLAATNSRTVHTGFLSIPAEGGSATTITFFPRYVDNNNHLAVRIAYTTGTASAGLLTVVNTTTFIRTRNGVATTLCTAPAAVTNSIRAGRLYRFDVSFEQSGALRVLTEGTQWCSLANENNIPFGDPGYAVEGAAQLDLGPVSISRVFDTCPDGSLRPLIPAGAGYSTRCNVGYSASGSENRTCLANGTLTGSALVCTIAPPTLTSAAATLPELSPAGTVVAAMTASNVARGQAIIYDIISGNTNGSFTIGGCDGVVRVSNPQGLDFEGIVGRASFSLTVRATVADSPATSVTATLTVTVTDIADPPYITTRTCTVNENSFAGATVCSLAVVDPDTPTPSYTLALLYQDVPGVFELSGNLIRVATAALNFESKSSYVLSVRAADSSDPTSFSDNSITVLVGDVNESPVVTGPAFVEVLSTDMVVGQGINQLIAFTDPDAGDAAASYTLSSVSGRALLAVGNSTQGDLRVALPLAAPCTLASLTLVDSRLVCETASMRATVTDARGGASGSLTFRVYVLPNITAGSALVRSFAVSPANVASGSGSAGSTHRIATDGSDAVIFSVDNLVAFPGVTVWATANASAGSPSWTVACDFVGLGTAGTSGGSPVAPQVRCPTAQGFGASWTWVLYLRDPASSPADTRIPSLVALVTSYAAPIITSVSVDDPITGAVTVPTSGSGFPVIVQGYNFAGGTGAAVLVEFGPDVGGGSVLYSYALSAVPSDVGHTSIRALVPPGSGSANRVRITVAGVTVEASPSVLIRYSSPVVTNVSLVGGGAAASLSGAGGDVLELTGADFGPLAAAYPSPAIAAYAAPKLYVGPAPAGPVVSPPAQFPLLYACTVAVAHTVVRCTVAPGAGAALSAVLTVAGTASGLVGPPRFLLSYAPPVLTAISGPGAREMDTKGGQTVVFSGFNFGPSFLSGTGAVFPAPQVFYGPVNDTLRFNGSACAVVGSAGLTAIQCLTAEGAGGGPLYFTAVVAGQASSAWLGPATARYSRPKVNALVAVAGFPTAATAAVTQGGELIILTGKSFGPYNVSSPVPLAPGERGYEVFYYGQASDLPGAPDALSTLRFRAPFCYRPIWDDNIKTHHERMLCVTSPGAGTALKWEVVVDGQASDEPTTSYAAPVLNEVTTSATGAAVREAAASTEGGTVVFLRGDFFGPVANPNVPAALNPARNFVQWVRFGPGGGAGPASYAPLDYALVADHTTIRVTLPPGIGKQLQFQVSVADVVSAPSPVGAGGAGAADGSFDYASPRVTQLAPATGPTAGGQIVKVFVRNAGFLDPTTEHLVTLGGMPVPVLDRFPSVLRVKAAVDARNMSRLTPDERDPTKQYLSFRSPPGTGASLPVVVTARRTSLPSSYVTNDPSSESPSTWFSYPAPVVDLVAVQAVTDVAVIALVRAAFGNGVDLTGLRQCTIFGRNFGLVHPNPGLQVADEATPTVFDGQVRILNHTDTSIIAVTTVPRGELRIAVRYRLPSDAPAVPDAVLYSNQVTYSDVSPSVLGISSGSVPAGGFSTAGGETVVLQAGNLASYTSLQVLIGGIQCPFIDTDGVTVVPPAQVKAVVTDPQAALQAGQGIPPKDMVFNLRVRVPPGQGSSVGIAIVRDAVNGTGPYYIRYAAPSVSTVSFLGGSGGSAPASSFTPSSPLRIPTTGATLTLSGANFGTCPVVTFGVMRGAYCSGDQQPTDELTLLSNPSHTTLVVTIPEGTGAGLDLTPPGYFIEARAADQRTFPVPAGYELPSVTSVVPSAPGGPGFPTVGGVLLNVTGSGFGPLSAPLPDVVFIHDASSNVSSPGVLACGDVRRSPLAPQTLLTCVLPAGVGASLGALVTVNFQGRLTPSVFSYNRPAISSVVNLDASDPAYNTSSGATPGGYRVRVDGRDFGPTVDGACVFLPSPGVPPSLLLCNDLADNLDEEQVAPRAIERANWTDTSVYFTVPPGMGRRSVRISVGGQLSDVAPASSFAYSAPVITGLTPATATTDGGDRVTITGRNFGFGTTMTSNAKRAGPVSFGPALVLPVPADTLPPRFALAVNLSSTRCISSSIDDSVTALTLLPAVQGCYSELRGASGVVSHTDTEIVFIVPPGVGKGLNLTVSVVNPEGSVVASAPVTFSYAAPALDSSDPSVWYIPPPAAVTPSTFTFPMKTLTFYGSNFGPYGNEASWSPQERQVSITVGGYPCNSASRKLVDGSVILQCEYARDAFDAPVPLNHPSVPRVGHKDVRAFVAGQESLPAPNLFTVGCQSDSYGEPGEVCLACPQGAVCDGYMASLEAIAVGSLPANVAKYGPRVLANVTTSWGFNVTQCVSCHTRPRALPGFFNMRGLVNKAGESETTCDAIRKAEGRRGPVDCESIVACDPPESCLGDNVCGEGYTNSKGWPYRCSACDEGFYRSSGSCRRCPNNPELNILFFFVVAVAAIAAGWFLNQKQVNIAFLTIGLDYMQVISIFASTRVAWPQQIQDLFRILSAFNLNIEVVAPECVFKSLQYTQKWGMIMALPLAVFALLLAIHGVNVFYAVCIRGQRLRGFAGDAASPLIAMAQVLMYFLYLYITRSVFDVMTCRSSDPAEYDPRTGELITYMAGVLERCGVPGGTQATLLPAAVAGLVVYVLGYPAAIGWNLWKNRALVMEDQLIRAKRSGDDRLTNPNAYTFRRRFSRAYYQFRPDAFLWVLAILGRKFLIAISALIFNTNQNFQMAAMLLVLFLAYAAQVRFLPYMGPANFDAVLKAHAEAAAAGHLAHARLVDILARIEARGRKRSHANTFSGARQKLSLSGAARALGTFLFDYNTVESILLASALLVALAGVMFGATQGSLGSSFYRTSRDGVTSAILIVIALSLLYWLTVVAAEIYGLAADERAARLQKSWSAGKGGAKQLDGGAPGSGGARRSLSGRLSADELSAVLSAPLETQANPMLTDATTGRALGAGGITTDDIRGMTQLSDARTWVAVREAYIAQADRAAALSAEVGRLKAQISRADLEREQDAAVATPTAGGGGGGGGNGGGAGSGPASPTAAVQRKKAFGPIAAAAGDPSAASVFSGYRKTAGGGGVGGGAAGGGKGRGGGLSLSTARSFRG